MRGLAACSLTAVLAAAGCGGPTSVLLDLRSGEKGGTALSISVITPAERTASVKLPQSSTTKLVLPATVVLKLDDNVGKVKVVAELEGSGAEIIARGFTSKWL